MSTMPKALAALPSEHRRERFAWMSPMVRAWATYDLASSTWAVLVPTVLYALYFRNVVAEGAARAEAWWGLTAGAALIVAGIVAPLVGARSDRLGSRLAWLVAATLLCCLATAAMPLVPAGAVLVGAAVFVAAQVGYTVAMSLYDAYLARIATPATLGRISAFGWAVGFLGGILCVVICLLILPPASEPIDVRLHPLFLVVALLFALLAAPAIAGLRRVDLPPPRQGEAATSSRSLRSLWKHHRNLLRFLLALYLINDALATISVFTAIYFKKHYGIGLEGLLKLVLLYHVLAIPATLAFGSLGDRVDVRRALYFTLSLWAAAVLLMAFGEQTWVPVIVVCLFAAVTGSTQALLRGAYACLVPQERAAEYFGWNALVGRVSAAAGPLAYAAVAAVSNDRLALLSVLGFLLAGAWAISGVSFAARPPGRPPAAHPEPARSPS
jgi:UMF1 family MFS transporter